MEVIFEVGKNFVVIYIINKFEFKIKDDVEFMSV